VQILETLVLVVVLVSRFDNKKTLNTINRVVEKFDAGQGTSLRCCAASARQAKALLLMASITNLLNPQQ